MFHNSWSKKLIHTFWDGPEQALGRAGAIRLKSPTHDIVAIAMYWPNRSTPAYTATVEALAKWLKENCSCKYRPDHSYSIWQM